VFDLVPFMHGLEQECKIFAQLSFEATVSLRTRPGSLSPPKQELRLAIEISH
jgi:hypothetical protein